METTEQGLGEVRVCTDTAGDGESFGSEVATEVARRLGRACIRPDELLGVKKLYPVYCAPSLSETLAPSDLGSLRRTEQRLGRDTQPRRSRAR